MAAPNPSCPSFKKWRGIASREKSRALEEAKPPQFAPKFNVYVPEELQDLLQTSIAASYSPDDLKKAVTAIKASDKNQWLAAVTAVRKALSKTDSPPIQEVVDLGALPRLVAMMAMGDQPKLQLEAAWAACNVASGNGSQCKAVVEAGAIAPALELLSSQDPELREQAAWLLGNIAGDGAALRDACLEAGMLSPLLAAAKKETHAKPLRQFAWLMLNVVRFKPRQRDTLLKVLPTLAQIVSGSKDSEILSDGLSGLAHIADECGYKLVADARHIVTLAAQLVNEHKTNTVVVAAAKVLSSLCCGDDTVTQAVVDTGVLGAGYKRALEDEAASAALLKEVCFALSNIAAGTKAQATAVKDAGLLAPLTRVLRRCDNLTVRRETVWALANMTDKGVPALDTAVLESGAAPMLAEVVKSLGTSERGENARPAAAAAEALYSMARIAAAAAADSGGPNAAVVAFQEGGVYDSLNQVVDQGLTGKALDKVRALLKDYPPPS